MCISFWLLDEHPAFWLVLPMNRDETLARPSQPIHLWEDEEECEIVGGRDEVGGEFFKSRKSPVAYLEEVAKNAHNYNGFNLVVADVKHKEMAYFSNRPNGSSSPLKVHKLTLGLHALSNGSLDADWPKMERGKKKLKGILSSVQGDSLPNELIVEQVLDDPTPAEDISLQVAETECPVELEQKLSSVFVNYPIFGLPYGTRSMSVVGIRRDGIVSFFERGLEDGDQACEVEEFAIYRWNLDKNEKPATHTYTINTKECGPMVSDAIIVHKEIIIDKFQLTSSVCGEISRSGIIGREEKQRKDHLLRREVARSRKDHGADIQLYFLRYYLSRRKWNFHWTSLLLWPRLKGESAGCCCCELRNCTSGTRECLSCFHSLQLRH
ncbi:hypothetical protein R1flu_005766 [Riccia fluitans]|uniref:Uncharacterized protein n=1 Tax=Riccia fluitans TaxID=41844 RepID=A0ABD1YX44_9MARC